MAQYFELAETVKGLVAQATEAAINNPEPNYIASRAPTFRLARDARELFPYLVEKAVRTLRPRWPEVRVLAARIAIMPNLDGLSDAESVVGSIEGYLKGEDLVVGVSEIEKWANHIQCLTVAGNPLNEFAVAVLANYTPMLRSAAGSYNERVRQARTELQEGSEA